MQHHPVSHRPGHSIAWGSVPHPVDPLGTPSPLAVYRYEPELPKPCIHPLTTPSGRVLTGFEPSDHVWHRGLWFTIKFVNEENFWEEREPFGTQENLEEPVVEQVGETGCTVRHRLAWTRPNGERIMREDRTIQLEDRGDAIAIDWSCDLIADADAVLDRTPFTTWGGYGGLAFRMTRELHGLRYLTPEGISEEPLTGQNHAWLGMDGKLDGGPDIRAAVATFDHPDNPRWPSPFYAKAQNGFTYMNPAILFHEPMHLAKGETLSLRYRVLVKDGLWELDELAAESERFTATGGKDSPAKGKEVTA